MSAPPTECEGKCDATAAVVTPSGRGAIAVVVIEGVDGARLVSDCFRPAYGSGFVSRDIGRILFGRWGDEDAAAEEVVACRRSEMRVEVHCHGGAVAAARILGDLATRGAKVIDSQAWRLRNADDPITAEADLALAQTTTERAARVLLDQRNGALRSAIESAIDAIDTGQYEAASTMLATLLGRRRIGRRLVCPWQIVLVGRPNVGKSSLINRLLGYERAIVFDQPGTTRDVVTAATALDGWPCELSDTAGLREAGDAIEQAGVERAMAQIARADLVVLVGDAIRSDGGSNDGSNGANDVTQWFRAVAPSFDGPVIRVENKCDLRRTTQARGESVGPASGCLDTSAITGEGIVELAAAIVGRLVGHAPHRSAAVPFTERQSALLDSASTALAEKRNDDATTSLRMCIGP